MKKQILIFLEKEFQDLNDWYKALIILDWDIYSLSDDDSVKEIVLLPLAKKSKSIASKIASLKFDLIDEDEKEEYEKKVFNKVKMASFEDKFNAFEYFIENNIPKGNLLISYMQNEGSFLSWFRIYHYENLSDNSKQIILDEMFRMSDDFSCRYRLFFLYDEGKKRFDLLKKMDGEGYYDYWKKMLDKLSEDELKDRSGAYEIITRNMKRASNAPDQKIQISILTLDFDLFKEAIKSSGIRKIYCIETNNEELNSLIQCELKSRSFEEWFLLPLDPNVSLMLLDKISNFEEAKTVYDRYFSHESFHFVLKEKIMMKMCYLAKKYDHFKFFYLQYSECYVKQEYLKKMIKVATNSLKYYKDIYEITKEQKYLDKVISIIVKSQKNKNYIYLYELTKDVKWLKNLSLESLMFILKGRHSETETENLNKELKKRLESHPDILNFYGNYYYIIPDSIREEIERNF